MIDAKTQERLDWLAAREICTSITCGPAAGFGIIWTVNCLSPRYLDFEVPLQAGSPLGGFDHAALIAVIHSIKLGFLYETGVEGPHPGGSR